MRRPWLVSLSIAGHLGIGFALYAGNTWGLQRLSPGKGAALSLGVLQPPAPAGGAPTSGQEVKSNPKLKKPVVKQTVQLELKKVATRIEQMPSTGGGGGGGETAGSGSGTVPGGTGTCTIEPCGEKEKPVAEQPKVELPKPPTSTTIRPDQLSTLRISGDSQVHPSERVKREMLDDGRPQTHGILSVCVGETGAVKSVKVLASTKYDEFDERLVAAVRGWRYRPYSTNGQALSVCSTVTFIYSIK